MPSVCSDLIEDIEDLARGDDVLINTIRQRRDLKIHLRKRKMEEEEPIIEPIDADSFIPGISRIYIKTWGCAHNNSDSEYMAGQLAASGYPITEDKFAADLWILNSCTVKSPAEDHFRNEIQLAKDNGKLLVVSGCVSQSAPKSPYLEGLSIVGVQQIDRVVEVVEETLKGHTVRLLGQKKEKGKKKGGASLQLPKIRKNPLVEIIAINTGCLNQCTYCKTKHARGHLGSYPIEEIVDRAKQAFQDGVCEIWLTSEDTGAYGRDIGVTLPELLYELVKVIPYGCMLRLGMTNPPYIYDYLEDIAQIMSLPSVYAFLHVPVQSGSDKVLADMKREYCVADFEKVVDFLRTKVPGITIATDIICGFPTESEEDFEETVKLVEKYKFPNLFINQFYPRPFTPAAKLPRIPTQEVKRRSKKLSEIFAQILPYSHKVGEIQRILVTEISKDRKHFVGHNKFYEQVLVPKRYDVMGRMLDVQILSTGKHFLMGKPIQTGNMFSPSIAPPLPQGSLSGFNEKNFTEGTSLTKDNVSAENQTRPLDASTVWKMCLIALIIAVLFRYISRWWSFS